MASSIGSVVPLPVSVFPISHSADEFAQKWWQFLEKKKLLSKDSAVQFKYISFPMPAPCWAPVSLSLQLLPVSRMPSRSC